MNKDWITNGLFAALTTASVYIVQQALTNQGVSGFQAFAAVLVCGIAVGVILRFALTAWLFNLRLFRRWFKEESAMEGLWLEILDRQGEQHYSVVTFKYDVKGKGVPFSMSGDSFFPDGTKHSEWGTSYMRIQNEANGFNVEYIYGADYKGHDAKEKGRPKYGYGQSNFRAMAGRPKHLVAGDGFYLAAESDHPFRCSYDLRLIDRDYKLKVRADNEGLTTEESLQRFILRVHAYE